MAEMGLGKDAMGFALDDLDEAAKQKLVEDIAKRLQVSAAPAVEADDEDDDMDDEAYADALMLDVE